MEKNLLPHTALLAGLVLAALLLMHFLPHLEVGGRQLRHVDLLADVRPLPPVQADTLPAVLPSPKPAFSDTCPPGMTCIEDYGDSTGRGMEAFYRALDEASSRPVRIAWLGDSFVEGDILTADLRALLQERYGGCGVGYLAMHIERVVETETGRKQALELAEKVSSLNLELVVSSPLLRAWKTADIIAARNNLFLQTMAVLPLYITS